MIAWEIGSAAMNESMAAVRGYLRKLRRSQGISQEELARHMGLSRRALIDWEMGRTRTIKSGALFGAVSFLRASVDVVRSLLTDTELTESDGEHYAELTEGLDRTGFTAEQRILLENLTPAQKELLLSIAREMQQ